MSKELHSLEAMKEKEIQEAHEKAQSAEQRAMELEAVREFIGSFISPPLYNCFYFSLYILFSS